MAGVQQWSAAPQTLYILFPDSEPVKLEEFVRGIHPESANLPQFSP